LFMFCSYFGKLGWILEVDMYHVIKVGSEDDPTPPWAHGTPISPSYPATPPATLICQGNKKDIWLTEWGAGLSMSEKPHWFMMGWWSTLRNRGWMVDGQTMGSCLRKPKFHLS
jgi:hypothetical protein